MELIDNIAVVTGAAQGIGKAIALELARNGADSAAVDLKAELAQGICDEIKSLGRRAIAVSANVANTQDAQNAVDSIVKEFGRIDILVNNAGVNRDAVVWKMTEEQWDTVIDVDLKGCFNFMRAIAPLYKSQASGKILNIASINGLRGKFGQANYSAAKAGRSADGGWIQIAYPPDSGGRGWVSSQFVQVQGSPDSLPGAEALPAPAVTPALETVDARADSRPGLRLAGHYLRAD